MKLGILSHCSGTVYYQTPTVHAIVKQQVAFIYSLIYSAVILFLFLYFVLLGFLCCDRFLQLLLWCQCPSELCPQPPSQSP